MDIEGAAGASCAEVRKGLAGIMMDAASIGRVGLGAIRGVVCIMGAGWMGGGGSATAVAVAASKTLSARSATSVSGGDGRE